MENLSPVLLALIGTLVTFAATTAGAATVFFFKHEINEKIQSVFMGFAAGIMIAASVWSLLIPAINMAEEQGQSGWLPAAGGFILGGLFLFLLDKLLPHLHPGSQTPEGLPSSLKRTTMLVFAVTLHNIPEGLAVGLAFAMAGMNHDPALLGAAISLAIGMSLQNLPEGAAISLPLKKEGASNKKAFLLGMMSGAVEPVAAVVGALLFASIVAAMPWMLSFAAGAMIYVVVEELIPEAHLGEHSHPGTFGVMAGFAVMMVLDVALG
ncbi:MAG: ZIP family metal transporter [Christensenellaceae bacterium]|jgi:ZIP family zinc transporter